MKQLVLAAMVSLGLMGVSGLALAAPARTPPGSGPIYTQALNILSAKGYHGMSLTSQSGDIVHATAITRTNKPVSLTINTATGTVQQG